MDSQAMATFFGLLLLGGAAGSMVAVAVPSVRAQMADAALPIAALVAVCATLGSLYFSEIADFLPCELCWFQRAAMYPLAVLLPFAAWRRDRRLAILGGLVALVGLGISMYHIQLQLFPEQSSFCDVSNPCSGRWVEAFGWMTIPQMAGTSFALIVVMTTLSLVTTPQETS